MTEDVKEKNEAVDEERSELAELRVRSNSPVKPLAGSITATMKQYGHVSLRCIGDGAIGRAVRGATIASGYLKPIGINLKMTGKFFETEINGEERTGLAIDLESE